MNALAAENTATLLTVSELNRESRLALEKSMPSCRVTGEISNFSRAGSGHWYFTLKDEAASVRAVMFRTRNQFVEWVPRDGDHVELRGQVTLYEARGDYQLVVDALRKAGQGLLFEAFLKLKEKLEQEGLFAEHRKRMPPRFPKCVGIVTSPQAAALRDVLTTLRVRWPLTGAILFPTPVQGEGSVQGISNAIETADLTQRCDVLLLVRGGGGLEDLHAFNSEQVARAIAASSIPIITGVGHETDFTIADFVSDMRAPTPTGAAQYATPNKIDQITLVNSAGARLNAAFARKTQGLSQHLDGLSKRLKHPDQRISLKRQQLQHVLWRMRKIVEQDLTEYRARFDDARRLSQNIEILLTGQRELLHGLTRRLAQANQSRLGELRTRTRFVEQQLRILDPESILHRGYSIIRNSHGDVVSSHEQVSIGERLSISLCSGHVEANVTSTRDS